MHRRALSLSAIIIFAGFVTMTHSFITAAQAAPALISAAENGDVAAVEQAIKTGSALETRDNRGRTALLAAVHGNHIDVAQLLIDAGADVNAMDAIDDSPYL